jgi:predicted Rossmann-fold nucleotide-binding protein
MGSDYWTGLTDWMRDVQLKYEMISPDDMDLLRIMDNPADAVRLIKQLVIM